MEYEPCWILNWKMLSAITRMGKAERRIEEVRANNFKKDKLISVKFLP